MSSSWIKTPLSHSYPIDLEWWMRAKASAHSLVWVANLQIPARGGNRSSTLLRVSLRDGSAVYSPPNSAFV